mmetsp:Transcript_9658/g.30685  ORF Transcript_9658/g.30685 Transcript_9658/m.30685 type:complete len:444 (-) Transcript_9658:127-1458(-)
MDDDWVEVASGTESQAPGPSVEAPGNSPAKFPGPPAEAPGDPKETAPRPSRHITIGIFSDATASLASHVNRLKSVAKAIFAIVQGVKAAGDDGLVVHIVMAAMRDWCDAAHVFRVYTEEKASIRAGAILPMAYTGAAGQDEHLLRTLDAMASDCQGGGDAPEEYGVGIAAMRDLMRSQRERLGDHPQFAIFVADDAHHGLTDATAGLLTTSGAPYDTYPAGSAHMPAEGGKYPPSVYECAYAPKNAAGRGQWQGVNALSTLGELLDEQVFAVWCAVGNAVRGCDTFLTALALQMEAESSRADGAPRRGFVFRYSGTGQAASDVPTQIATLICQHVKGQELPRVDCIRLGGGSLEQALKARAAEVGARVSATLAAATPHFAPFRRASGDADAVAGRLERLAVLPTLSRSNSFSLCERMAEGDRAFAAAYRSLKPLQSGPPLSSP